MPSSDNNFFRWDASMVAYSGRVAGAGSDIVLGRVYAGTSRIGASRLFTAPLVAASTPGDDTITGTIFGDFLAGGGGNDTISGLGGNDALYGESGNDILRGGDDHDRLQGGIGNDRLDGDAGGDRAYGDEGLDQLNGGGGADILLGLADADTLDGGTEDDRLYGDSGDDALAGGDGNDLGFGWIGNDVLNGGAGDDRLAGEDGNDNVSGGEGQDILFGDRDTAPLSPSAQQVIDLNIARIGAGDFAILYQGPTYTYTGLRDSPHDLIIVNPARQIDPDTPRSEQLWLASEVNGIEAAGKRLVAYFNVSKINDFVNYWQTAWTTTQDAEGTPTAAAPAFLGEDDPDYDHTRLVKYWEASWREVVEKRVKEIVGQGFSGIFLDDVLAYYSRRGDTTAGIAQAAREMRDLVIYIADVARTAVIARDGSVAAADQFTLIVNGAPFLISDATADGTPHDAAKAADFYASIDAFLAENYFSEFNQVGIDKAVAEFGSRGIALLAVDTGITSAGFRILIERSAVDAGFLPEVVSAAGYGTDSARFRADFGDVVLPGDDRLDGGPGDDILTSGSGTDVLIGGDGNDVLYFGATFAGGDQADGGAGRDALVLQGNVTVTFGIASLAGIESISLQSGATIKFGDTANNFYDFSVTMVDANVAAGVQLIVNGQSLRAGEDMTFNGSGEHDGRFLVYGGHGVDILKGGNGNDIFFFEGLRYGPNDKVDGGAGQDSVVIAGVGGINHIEFAGNAFTSIESISVNNLLASDPSQKPSYELVLANGNVAPGGILIVNANSLVDPAQQVNFNGSAVTGGNLSLFGGAGHDILTAGSGADLLYGGRGADGLSGGNGADIFRYDSTLESVAGLNDTIGDFQTGLDKIDLSRIDANTQAAGDQAFAFIGANAFSGAAGQLRVFAQGGYQRVEGDTNGDMIADLVIILQVGTAPIVQGDFFL